MWWPHIGALGVTKAPALFPPVSDSLKEDSSLPSAALPSDSRRGLEEPSHSKEWGCKVPLQDNCISSRNHTSTLDKQQAALLLPANRINLNAHRHSWAKSKHRAETKLHHLMAKCLRGSHSTHCLSPGCCSHGEEKPYPCPSSPLAGTSSTDRRTSEVKPRHPVLVRAMGRKAPGFRGPGVLAAEGRELSFWSSSNGKVSYKQRGHGSVVNTTKDSGSSGCAANQLTPEWVTQCSAKPVVYPNHRKRFVTPNRETSTHCSNSRGEMKTSSVCSKGSQNFYTVGRKSHWDSATQEGLWISSSPL